ncbi:MAG: hypothetical protein L3J93_00605 [Thermoplasmata archaeon]|nr:hypothetical protein [Thermoplasmata archaeon]
MHCPFCQAPETERVRIDGASFVIFQCMFTPQVDPAHSDAEIEATLASQHPDGGAPYFRQMCDSLHLYVTKGAGSRPLPGAGQR